MNALASLPTAPAPSLLRRVPVLGLLLLLPVLAVGSLSYWDERREQREAFEDFGQAQASLALSAAIALGTRLSALRGQPAAPSAELFSGLAQLARPHAVALLVAGPDQVLRAPNGSAVASPVLAAALAAGESTVRLVPAEAAALGLPERTAMAGLARVPAEEGRPGGWRVVVVASAGRERDREQRARIRLVITVALVAHLVLVFGVLALRQQRKEHALERELATAEVARERDQRLSQQSRAATMVTFAGGVAHEISTPLGVIAGRAENLMARPDQDERTRRSLQTIVEQTAYIKEVIRGFLDLARGATPVLSEALPSSVVSAAAAMVEHRLHKAGVRLEVGSAEGLPSVRCDPRLLEHAIINLLLNACDASPRGGTVRLQASAAAQTLAFVVSDEGAGIPQALASRVTEPFFTTKALGEGTGLGLAIASEIAKIHSGRLRLEAGVPRGTRASLEIPLLLPTAAPLAGKQPERARDA